LEPLIRDNLCVLTEFPKERNERIGGYQIKGNEISWEFDTYGARRGAYRLLVVKLVGKRNFEDLDYVGR
jgi:hypothetical protein